MANRSNDCFSSFTPLDLEFSSGLRIIDNFSDCISFNICDKEKDNKSCIYQLDEIVLESSSSLSVIIIASDMNIKNNVNKPLTKTIHHIVLITSTEAELFAIRYGINQAINFNNIAKIIVVTDFIHAARKIFDSSVHLYQIQSAAILSKLHKFFNYHKDNFIEFWKCPSCFKWCLYGKVDKETKLLHITPLYPCKSLWEFSKKSECDNIANAWKIMF